MKKNEKRVILFGAIYGVIAQYVIRAFLDGKFVTLEKGTHAGALQRAIGLAIIIGVGIAIGALLGLTHRYLRIRRIKSLKRGKSIQTPPNNS